MSEDETNGISDVDRDSMHILPLSILPIETPGLNHARLIKNIHLDSMVEIFQDEGTGSGQCAVGALSDEFGWPEHPPHPDRLVMKKLAGLPSYDVYSLRMTLRENGIKVNDHDALRLSDNKTAELSNYMTAFTRPLLRELFAGDADDAHDFSDILSIFRDPDIARVKAKLQAMSEKLEIPLQEIPGYLEKIGDTFLSISYYRQCNDSVSPIVDGFNESVEEIQGNFQLKSDRNLMKTCEELRHVIGDAHTGVARRFFAFDKVTDGMWKDPSPNQFRQIQMATQECHHFMGQTLCGLTVKMDSWNEKFPNMDTGGPMKRAEFLMQNMKQGIKKMMVEQKFKVKKAEERQIW